MNDRGRRTILFSFLFLWSLGSLAPLYGQDDYSFTSIKTVEEEFQQKLNSVRPSTDTIEIYANYVKRLVRRGNYEKADTILQKHINGFIETNDKDLLAEVYKSRAFMYKVQGRFTKSLDDYLWLKDYYETKEDLNEMVSIYSQMAEYYRAIRGYELMATHLDMAKAIIDNEEIDTRHIAYWYSRKASWGTEYQGIKDSTEIFAKEGYRLALEANDVYTQALTLNELGYLYQHSNTPRDFYLSYYDRSRKLFFEQERYRDYVDVTINYIREINGHDEEQTYEIIQQILPMQRENNWFSIIPTLQVAQDQYRRLGMTKEIDEAQMEIYEARMRENMMVTEVALSEMALSYENELTKKELEVQEQQTQLAKAEALNNKRAFTSTAILAFLLLIITIGVIIINRRFKKKNILLSERKKEVEESNTKLEQSLDHQKALYQELNHRVKNNLTILTGLIYLQEVDEESRESKEAFETLRNRVKSMALAHENLYKSDHQTKIDFQNYLVQLFNELKLSLSDPDKIETEIECNGYELEMLQAVPLAIVLNEFFTNTIKHAFEGDNKGSVKVSALQENKTTIIEYSDNGRGYSVDEMGNSTLGLRLVKLLMQQLKATFEDLTTANGVHYKFVIPDSDYQPKAVNSF